VGIDYAIAKSLAAAPFADLLWMETKTANLDEARRFGQAIHADYPDKMLAYNLSPSFNWDTTGLSDDEMRQFPDELGKLGFVFNFITYGGHQIDGLAAEEFATALRDDGMLALARLQRKFRLLESPYRAPQSLVGGDRLDAALMAASGRTAATRAMGAGSTQHQHLVQTEVPRALLDEWLAAWSSHWDRPGRIRAQLRPHTAGSHLLEVQAVDASGEVLANVIFASIVDRRGRSILSIRDQHTAPSIRRRRLMTLVQLFLIHRYRRLRALRHADRGQPLPDAADEGPRHLHGRPYRDRADHRRGRGPGSCWRAGRARRGTARGAHPQAGRPGRLILRRGVNVARAGDVDHGRTVDPLRQRRISRGRSARRRPSATGSGRPIGQ
jgi:Isocitrate lyase family